MYVVFGRMRYLPMLSTSPELTQVVSPALVLNRYGPGSAVQH